MRARFEARKVTVDGSGEDVVVAEAPPAGAGGGTAEAAPPAGGVVAADAAAHEYANPRAAAAAPAYARPSGDLARWPGFASSVDIPNGGSRPHRGVKIFRTAGRGPAAR